MHSGALASHMVPQLPQWLAELRSSSQPSSALVLQCAKPGAHEAPGTTHWPSALQLTLPCTFGSWVQS